MLSFEAELLVCLSSTVFDPLELPRRFCVVCSRRDFTAHQRHYLAWPIIPAHRKAITSVMFSSHDLAIERLRWRERYRDPVPREWRLCRFCRASVEDEVHALLECCHAPRLLELREEMRREMAAVLPCFYWHPDLRIQLLRLLHDKRLPVPIAKFVFNVLSVFYSEPMYVPAPHLYAPLLLAHA